MCGIIGYAGFREAAPLLVSGLEKLAYRGYDSAGIAVLDGKKEIQVIKCAGKIEALKEKLSVWGHPQGFVGVGHTRWATHGEPNDVNSHPHVDCAGKFAVVHNGIIENYAELKAWLMAQGHVFCSQTDTEVLPHLCEHFYTGDLLEAVLKTREKLRGSYALVALAAQEPERLVAARQDSPLIIGRGGRENFFASDIPALLEHTRQVQVLENGEIAVLTPEEVIVYNETGKRQERPLFAVNWGAAAAAKGGYPHFMLKEICEQPEALRETFRGRILPEEKRVDLGELSLSEVQAKSWEKISIVACGTAYHAGMVGKYIFEKLLRIPVEVELASEFRYREPLVDVKTLVLVISQSGETADTLAALREARKRGAEVLAITNVVGSSVAREADKVLYTRAGPEVAVASTKAYITQLAVLYIWGIYLARLRERLTVAEERETVLALEALPEKVEKILNKQEEIKALGTDLSKNSNVFFIGRGLDWAVALEGALKLKEISYLHAEAYAAGELKHGTLALIEPGVPVIVLATQEALYEKIVSNVQEVKARGGYVIGFGFTLSPLASACDKFFALPPCPSFFAPVLAVVPLQLLAYFTACTRGCDVDQPRNLAKSVTVE